MSLSDFVPSREVVEFKGGQFSVRGITTDDLSELIRVHGPTIQMLYNSWQSESSVPAVITLALMEAPVLCAHIIALACEEEGVMGKAIKLPFPVQLGALETITKLTFETVGGVGNAVATLKAFLEKVNANRNVARISP